MHRLTSGVGSLPDVMGPDDWHPKVNNNAYTNAAASLSIHFARYLACLCNRTEKVPDEWIHKALFLSLPYDNVKRLHFQHEGFEHGACLLQHLFRHTCHASSYILTSSSLPPYLSCKLILTYFSISSATSAMQAHAYLLQHLFRHTCHSSSYILTSTSLSPHLPCKLIHTYFSISSATPAMQAHTYFSISSATPAMQAYTYLLNPLRSN